MKTINKYNILLLWIETQIKDINKKTQNWEHIYLKNSTLEKELTKRMYEILDIIWEFDLWFSVTLENKTWKNKDFKISLTYDIPF